MARSAGRAAANEAVVLAQPARRVRGGADVERRMADRGAQDVDGVERRDRFELDCCCGCYCCWHDWGCYPRLGCCQVWSGLSASSFFGGMACGTTSCCRGRLEQSIRWITGYSCRRFESCSVEWWWVGRARAGLFTPRYLSSRLLFGARGDDRQGPAWPAL